MHRSQKVIRLLTVTGLISLAASGFYGLRPLDANASSYRGCGKCNPDGCRLESNETVVRGARDQTTACVDYDHDNKGHCAIVNRTSFDIYAYHLTRDRQVVIDGYNGNCYRTDCEHGTPLPSNPCGRPWIAPIRHDTQLDIELDTAQPVESRGCPANDPS